MNLILVLVTVHCRLKPNQSWRSRNCLNAKCACLRQPTRRTERRRCWWTSWSHRSETECDCWWRNAQRVSATPCSRSTLKKTWNWRPPTCTTAASRWGRLRFNSTRPRRLCRALGCSCLQSTSTWSTPMCSPKSNSGTPFSTPTSTSQTAASPSLLSTFWRSHL